MTRTWADPRKGEAGGWAMYCDEGCGNQSDTRPRSADLPLEEFQDAGWFIGYPFGDVCPRCLAAGVQPTADAEWRRRR
jgi:hypothetical protein